MRIGAKAISTPPPPRVARLHGGSLPFFYHMTRQEGKPLTPKSERGDIRAFDFAVEPNLRIGLPILTPRVEKHARTVLVPSLAFSGSRREVGKLAFLRRSVGTRDERE